MVWKEQKLLTKTQNNIQPYFFVLCWSTFLQFFNSSFSSQALLMSFLFKCSLCIIGGGQRLFRKPESINTGTLSLPLRGGNWDKLDPDINSCQESHDRTGGSELNKLKVSVKDQCCWRGSNRKTHQKGHSPHPPISSGSSSNSVSVLPIIWNGLQKGFQCTHMAKSNSFCSTQGLTNLLTAF